MYLRIFWESSCGICFVFLRLEKVFSKEGKYCQSLMYFKRIGNPFVLILVGVVP